MLFDSKSIWGENSAEIFNAEEMRLQQQKISLNSRRTGVSHQPTAEAERKKRK